MEKEVNFVVELSSGIPAAPGTGIFLDNPGLTISGLSAIVAGLFVASLFFRKLLSRAVTARSVHRNYRRLTLTTIVFLACFSLSGIHFFHNFHVFAASHIKHTTDGKTIIEADILGTDRIAIVKDSIKIPEATKWGYQLYFYYQDSDQSLGRLIHNTDASQSLTPVKDSDQLRDNNYGVSTTSPTFSSIWRGLAAESTAQPIRTIDTATNSGDTIDVYYGIKAKDLKPGIYQGRFFYKIVPNPDPRPKMQDMTSEKCQNLELNKQYEFVDARDGKDYYVARLKMNRAGAETQCFMTENLDLDLSANTTLTHADTDLGHGQNNYDENATWTPNKSTSQDISDWVYDPDDYIYYQPLSYDSGDLHRYPTYLSDTNEDTEYTSLTNCILAGHEESECKHYHVGNHYNWPAAVAMNDTSQNHSVGYENVDQSICPAGWRLPTGREYYRNEFDAERFTGEFSVLVASYDIIPGSGVGNRRNTSFNNGGFDQLRLHPLYLTLAGYVYPDASQDHSTSEFWLSYQAADDIFANSFYFDQDGIYGGRAENTEGQSVRCVARGGYSYKLNLNDPVKPDNNISHQVSIVEDTKTFYLDSGFVPPDTAQYRFLGYANSATAITPDYAYDKVHQTFTPNAITLTSAQPETTLYVVWQKKPGFAGAFAEAGKQKIELNGQQYYKMQDMTSEICQNVFLGDSAATTETETLVDIRDNKTYTVAKLKSNQQATEGNCWMTKSLRIGSVTENITLTPADSNIQTNFTLPARTLSQNWDSSYNTVEYYPSDDKNTNPGLGPLDYYGYYYNFYTATAGTVTNTPANAIVDICPKGWSLPTNYSNYLDNSPIPPDSDKRSFSSLLYAYEVIDNPSADGIIPIGLIKSKILTSSPLNFMLPVEHGGPSLQLEFGHWSGYSNRIEGSAFVMRNSLTQVIPQLKADKRKGAHIRCIAK